MLSRLPQHEHVLMEANPDGSINVYSVRLVRALPAGAVHVDMSRGEEPGIGRIFGGKSVASQVNDAAQLGPQSAMSRQIAELIGDGAPIEGTPISMTDPRLVWIMFDRGRWSDRAARAVIEQWTKSSRSGKRIQARIPKRLRSESHDDGITSSQLEDWLYFRVANPRKFDTDLHCIEINGGVVLVVGDRLGNKYKLLGSVKELAGARPCET